MSDDFICSGSDDDDMSDDFVCSGSDDDDMSDDYVCSGSDDDDDMSVCSGSDDDDMSDEGTDDTLNNTSRERTGEQAHRFTSKNIFKT